MTMKIKSRLTENLDALPEFFILGNEPCIGFYESKLEQKGWSVYEFQTYLTHALRLMELVKTELDSGQDGRLPSSAMFLQSLLDRTKGNDEE